MEVQDKCLGVIPLKPGCIMLGIVNSLLTFFLGLILVAMAIGLRDHHMWHRRHRPDVEDPAYSDVAFAILIFMAILLFLKFAADLLFVWAVYTNRHGIVKKYFIFWILFVVLFIIGNLKIMFQMRTDMAVGCTMFLAFNLYYISVVRSYMIKINEDNVV